MKDVAPHDGCHPGAQRPSWRSHAHRRTLVRSASRRGSTFAPLAVTTVLSAAAFGVFVWSLTVGDFPIALSDVLATLHGDGSD